MVSQVVLDPKVTEGRKVVGAKQVNLDQLDLWVKRGSRVHQESLEDLVWRAEKEILENLESLDDLVNKDLRD